MRAQRPASEKNIHVLGLSVRSLMGKAISRCSWTVASRCFAEEGKKDAKCKGIYKEKKLSRGGGGGNG